MHFNITEIITYNLVIEWPIRLIMLFVVPRNRKPSSATAWLVLIMIFPVLGLIIFLLIGGPKLSKSRRAMQGLMDDKIKELFALLKSNPKFLKFFVNKVPDRIAPLVNLNTKLSFLPILSGNHLELISDYDKNYQKLIEDIKQAKSFIHIEFYIITLDHSTSQLFDALDEAANRGVKVRLLYDAVGSRRYRTYRAMVKRLRKTQIEWHKMLPIGRLGPGFNRPDLRNHRKIIVIDGLVGYTGSQNIICKTYHRKDKIYYDELTVRLLGPAVVELGSIFATDWYCETKYFLDQEILASKHHTYNHDSNSYVQVLPSGPAYRNDNNLKLFTGLIHAAKAKIVIVNPYFVPDDSLMIAITSAAQRGVEVTMINSEVIDQKLVGHAQRSYYEELLTAGVKIYWYNSPILLHSKSISVDDDIAIIGSSNLDIRSFQLSLEITMLIYDKITVSQLHKIEDTYLAGSKQVTLSYWQQRPLRSILLDNLARLTAALQ